jgi:hypothetical protein
VVNTSSIIDFQEALLVRRRAAHVLGRAAGLGLMLILAGCATETKKGGDPGAREMPAGYTCQSVRQELNRLDAKGTRSKVEAATAGQKLNPQAQAEVDRYNELLNYYLGARCHV